MDKTVRAMSMAEDALAALLTQGSGFSGTDDRPARIRALVEEAHLALDEAK